MTPAIEAAKRAGIRYETHAYEHDPEANSYGGEAAEKLGQDAARVFKTLVAELDGKELVVAILPVAGRLQLKKLASALGAKRAKMADPQKVERTTGYVLGGVSPLGQRKALRTVLDASAQAWSSVYISAGRRGLELELAPADLLQLTRGRYADVQE